MIEVHAPEDYSKHKGKHTVFLAGSIDMGNAVHWQVQVTEGLRDIDILVLNPRRHYWDEKKGKQSKDNPLFREQVEWELDGMDVADTILFYIAPDSRSPVSLMELGFYAARNSKRLIVCCPNGYWRKANVDIICERSGVMQVNCLESLVEAARKMIKDKAA